MFFLEKVKFFFTQNKKGDLLFKSPFQIIIKIILKQFRYLFAPSNLNQKVFLKSSKSLNKSF